MNIKIHKLSPDATIPKYGSEGAAGMDLVATTITVNRELGYIEYGTGLSIEIPEDHVGYLFPRSSISNTAMLLCNSVGVIDSDYRGEIKARFRCFDHREYKVGDRIVQIVIMPVPHIEFVEVFELHETLRGEAAFGSTGL